MKNFEILCKMVINSCTGFTLKRFKINLQYLRNVGEVNIGNYITVIGSER